MTHMSRTMKESITLYLLKNHNLSSPQVGRYQTVKPSTLFNKIFICIVQNQTIVFFSLPIPSISLSRMSPLCRNSGGLRCMPTPAGVPVRMTSPGYNVTILKQQTSTNKTTTTTLLLRQIRNEKINLENHL